MKKYYPVLVSKKGERVALQHLGQDVKEGISPVIQVVKKDFIKAIRNDKKEVIGFEYSNDLRKYFETHWIFFNNQVVFDFSLFEGVPEHIIAIEKFLNYVFYAGVNVVPMIQFNSDKSYFNLVKKFLDEKECKVCIRISNSSGGFLDIKDNLKKFLTDLKTASNNVILLFDLGQVNENNYNMLATIAGMSIQTLDMGIYNDIVVASSSFPLDMTELENQLKPKKMTYPQKIKRYEWGVWQTLKKSTLLESVKYGDYGTKNAVFSDAGHAGTISLKYTLKEEYIIYKGKKSDDHPDGNRQYITHSKNLVNSENFSGSEFSWGDMRISNLSTFNPTDENSKPGNLTDFVKNSQNHHITLLHSIL